MIVATRPLTSALIAMLGPAVDCPVGDHDPPRPTVAVPKPTQGRYLIVWKLAGGEVDGAWGSPHEQAVVPYQIDAHGRSREQCEWLADRVRQVVLDRAGSGWLHPITIAGGVVAYRSLRTTDTPENEGQDETGQPLFVCRESYELTVVPA